MKHKATTPKAPLPLPDDKPLIHREEAERAKASYHRHFLTEEERLAIIAKYGAPKAPYKPNRTGYDSKRGGRGA